MKVQKIILAAVSTAVLLSASGYSCPAKTWSGDTEEQQNPQETYDFAYCAERASRHVPDGLSASFYQIGQDGHTSVVGVFQNNTGKDICLELNCFYGDERGNFRGSKEYVQPLLPDSGEFAEVFDMGEDYQSFLIQYGVRDVAEDIYARYEAIEVQPAQNEDNSIDIHVTGADPDEGMPEVKVFYFDEDEAAAGYASADFGDAGSADAHLDAPSFDYDSFRVIWTCTE